MTLFSSTLVINLDRDKERWESVQKQCEKISTNPIRIPAVYGAKLSDNERREQTTHFCYNFCTASMIGCWLSHKKCWEYIVENNIDRCLILEDDAIFIDDFSSKLEKVMKDVPSDWDVLLLGTVLSCSPNNCGMLSKIADFLKSLYIRPSISKEKITDNIYRPSVFTGTQAYLITKEGAIKLLKLLSLADGHVDIGIASKSQNIKLYSTSPSLVIQNAKASKTTQHNNFPRILNNIADKFQENNTGLGFILSSPLGQIKGYLVNLWFILFFLYGILLCRVKNKIPFLITIIILFIAEFLYSKKYDTFIQILGSSVVIIFGYILCSSFQSK